MSYTFSLGDVDLNRRQIARVRNITNDIGTGAGGGTEGRDYFLSDERILALLEDEATAASAEADVARLAAADALDTLATSEAYVQKVQTTLGEQTDGAAVAKAIREHAASLRAQVAASAVTGDAGESFTSQLTRADGYSTAGDEYARALPGGGLL